LGVGITDITADVISKVPFVVKQEDDSVKWETHIFGPVMAKDSYVPKEPAKFLPVIGGSWSKLTLFQIDKLGLKNVTKPSSAETKAK